jgi:outer membrane autotransporter protein
MYGGAQQRNDSQTTTAFGISRTVGTSYRQDAFGGQLGFDLGGTSGESAFVFGVTGGYVNSELTFRSSADRTSYNAVNGGVYASFVSGNVFANALAKYDYLWINSRSPAANFNDRYHGQSYGAQGELGIRFGSDAFYAEPIVSASYVRTNLDTPDVTNATLDFDNLDGLRGKAGLRIGSAFNTGASRAVVYLSGNAVHEFKGRNGLTFTSGGTAFNYRNDRLGTYGEGKIGFNITTPGGVTGFVEGFGNYSDEYKGGGGRAGLRVKF